MRWLTFGLLAALTLCVHTTMARSVAILDVVPDFMFIVLVHYALHARMPRGLVAGWVLGVLVDLASVERLGIVSLAYGLAVVAIWSIRDLVFVRHPLTHFFVTCSFCLAVQIMLRGYHELMYDSATSGVGLVGQSFLTAVYSGLWAVVVHRVLQRCSRLLGLNRPQGGPFDTLRGATVV